MNSRRRVAITLCSLGTLAGCRTSTEPVTATIARPMTVIVQPGQGTTVMCQTIQLTVVVHDFEGALGTPDSTRWWNSDTIAVSISPNGMLKSRHIILLDTLRVTVWHGAEAVSAQSVWTVLDGGPLVPGPDGKPIPTKCPPGF